MYPGSIQNHLRIKPRRSAVMWLLAAILLAYVGLFQHQIAHQLDDSAVHCAQCLAADHFGHAPLTDIPTLPVIRYRDPPSPVAAVLFIADSTSYFSARAPPGTSLA